VRPGDGSRVTASLQTWYLAIARSGEQNTGTCGRVPLSSAVVFAYTYFLV
jgi:hypothetical protein